MAALAKPGYILRGSTPLLYSTSIEEKITTGDKPVHTNVLGHAGFSDGSESAEYSVRNAVLQAGYEFDAAYYALNHLDVTLKFKIANVITTVTGRITDVSVSTSAEGVTEQSFTFSGPVSGRVTV
jgi:hypothetical protein